MMGYNTTVLVLNDALDQIETDPTFGKNLAEAIRRTNSFEGRQDVRAGNHCNAASVIETHHSNNMVVVAVGGNLGRVLCPGAYEEDEALDILEALAADFGAALKRKV